MAGEHRLTISGFDAQPLHGVPGQLSKQGSPSREHGTTGTHAAGPRDTLTLQLSRTDRRPLVAITPEELRRSPGTAGTWLPFRFGVTAQRDAQPTERAPRTSRCLSYEAQMLLGVVLIVGLFVGATAFSVSLTKRGYGGEPMIPDEPPLPTIPLGPVRAPFPDMP